ncbi:AsmA family protein [Caldovatus aquaticus]|uniref:AsmA family protein n=1 Tax=Caldovatus aquaticus TaxID=2865671 RepID=A0ABS7F4U1_9PROT|nr:AsmA family protein [Caldovatus aquaticus]MBW8269796.1 AsmA family protein [Caldovatus aquaticus]
MPATAAPAPAESRRGRRALRRVLVALLLLLLLLPLAAAGLFLATFDAEAWKPRLAAAVESATGRTLTLAGPVSVAFGLTPAIALEGVALANLPGGSRPEMLTLRRAELRLALLPLLAREIRVRRLVLVEPDLLLEADAQGRPNWLFQPAAAPAVPAAEGASRPAEAAREAGRRLGIAVDALTVERGRVTYRAAPGGASPRVVAIAIPRLDAAAPAEGPVRLEGTLQHAGVPVALRAEGGPLSALGSPGRAWPVRLSAHTEGLRLDAEGALAAPGAGWRLRVRAEAADLARLAPLVPDLPLPPLRQVAASAELAAAEAGAPWPVTVADLRLRAGPSDLGALRQGLALNRLDLAAPAPDRPVQVAVEAALGPLPLRLEGTLGAPLALLRGDAPFPVELALGAGAASGTVKGAIADPRAIAGVDLRLEGRVPDLAELRPLLGDGPLPPLRDVTLAARLAERGVGFAGGAVLRELRLESPAGDVAGEVAYAIGARDAVAARLASRRLRLDALLPPRPAAASPAAAAPPPSVPPGDVAPRRVIPEILLPVAALGLLDADLVWRIAVLSGPGGAVWRDVEAQIALEAGRGRAGLRAGATPTAGRREGGALSLTLGVEARQDPPAVSLAARAPDLDLAGLLAAFGQPPRAAGRLWLAADLRGRGRDTRALAATLDGGLGLAATEGEVEAALLEPVLAPLRRSNLPLPPLPARIAVSCLALRVAVEDGVARSQAMLLDSAIGRFGGGGALNLRDESLALRLLPDIRAAGVAVRAPVHVAGTLAAPRLGVDPAAAAAGGLEAFLSLQNTPDRTLQALAGALGGGAAATLPDCAAQLAVARGESRPAPAAAPAQRPAEARPAAPSREPAPGLPGGVPPPVQNLLRGLLGR